MINMVEIVQEILVCLLKMALNIPAKVIMHLGFLSKLSGFVQQIKGEIRQTRNSYTNTFEILIQEINKALESKVI